MSRSVSLVLLILVAAVIILVVTVNVTRCDTVSGPFGFLRFTACTQEPLVNPA